MKPVVALLTLFLSSRERWIVCIVPHRGKSLKVILWLRGQIGLVTVSFSIFLYVHKLNSDHMFLFFLSPFVCAVFVHSIFLFLKYSCALCVEKRLLIYSLKVGELFKDSIRPEDILNVWPCFLCGSSHLLGLLEEGTQLGAAGRPLAWDYSEFCY